VTITGTKFQSVPRWSSGTCGDRRDGRERDVDHGTDAARSDRRAVAVNVVVTNPDATAGTANKASPIPSALAVVSVRRHRRAQRAGHHHHLRAGFTSAVSSSVTVAGVAATNVQSSTGHHPGDAPVPRRRHRRRGRHHRRTSATLRTASPGRTPHRRGGGEALESVRRISVRENCRVFGAPGLAAPGVASRRRWVGNGQGRT